MTAKRMTTFVPVKHGVDFDPIGDAREAMNRLADHEQVTVGDVHLVSVEPWTVPIDCGSESVGPIEGFDIYTYEAEVVA